MRENCSQAMFEAHQGGHCCWSSRVDGPEKYQEMQRGEGWRAHGPVVGGRGCLRGQCEGDRESLKGLGHQSHTI